MHASVIKLDELSGQGGSLSGELPVSQLPRLRELLSAPAATPIHYHLSGERDTGGRCFVQLALSATLPLFCQRCMERFDCRIDSERRFCLGTAAEEKGLVDDSCELLDTARIVLSDFIDEETILSIPSAPAHPLAECPAKNYIVA